MQKERTSEFLGGKGMAEYILKHMNTTMANCKFANYDLVLKLSYKKKQDSENQL